MIKTASRIARLLCISPPSTSTVRWECLSISRPMTFQAMSSRSFLSVIGTRSLLQRRRSSSPCNYLSCMTYATSSSSEHQNEPSNDAAAAEKQTARQKKEAERLERQAEREKKKLMKEAEQLARASRKARHQYNKLAAANGMPKPPPSIFSQYLRDFSKQSGKLSHADFMLQAQATWKQMDPDKKESLNKKYEDAYEAAKAIYDVELAQWHTKMIESGKKSILDEMAEFEAIFRPPKGN
uniref:HMG box domain-containing protein n=1 Tax=Plectus sambesii TaxID=2011161 RepID=A0A914XKR0_9BILA